MGFYEFVIAMTAIIMVFGLPLALVMLVVIGIRKKRGSLTDEELKQLEQTWAGLARMEDRIGNLETILLERHRARERTT